MTIIQNKPVIGILGGCGPLATLDIENKLLSTMSVLLSTTKDQDYYPMIIFQSTQLSDRNQIKKQNNYILRKQLKLGIEKLILCKVDIILVACQSAHVFLDLSITKNVQFVNMIDTTVSKLMLNLPNLKRVGLLATDILCQSNLYQQKLQTYNIEVITPPRNLQEQLMKLIYVIKAQGTNVSSIKTINPMQQLEVLIDHMQQRNCDGIILGCTELPLLLSKIKPKQREIIIDPNQLCAEEVIFIAQKLEQSNVCVHV